MRFGWLAAAGIALTAAAPVFSQDGAETKVPAFQAKDWIQHDGMTDYADFAGQVLLLESWATT